MILDEIVFENFGAFAGRQSMNLTPKDGRKRITMIGAMNGRGKTTTLDAIQLALYGNRAKLSNRGSLSYDTYLERARYRGANSEDNFAVELAFSIQDTQGIVSYRVRRAWKTGKRGPQEILEVSRDGKRDRALTETWTDHIEELLPLEISGLFFFDGEKIAQLADPVQASHVISAAVTGLLGLGIIERLQRDLLVLVRRKQDAVIPEEEKQNLVALDELVLREEERSRIASQAAAAQQTLVDRLEHELEKTQERARKEGGELFERRAELENSRHAAQAEVMRADQLLREIAGGPLPLLLCLDLVRSLGASSSSGLSFNSAELAAILTVRDEEILDLLKAQGQIQDLDTLAEVLQEDRERRNDMATNQLYEPPISATRAAKAALEHVSDDHHAILTTLEERSSNHELVADFDRQIAGIPSAEMITEILEKREALQLEVASARGRLDLLIEECQKVERDLDAAKATRERERQTIAMSHVEALDAGRIIEHSIKVRETLDQLKEQVRINSIASIEEVVLKCFKKLLGKNDFVHNLNLDKRTCEPTVTNQSGQQLHMERLSAGERQLFAVSMLWGLAIVSGRQLPIIIDTPLGRLDSVHRSILVERYFPQAADQVILLSTDREIDAELAAELEPATGRWYLIEYQADGERSNIREGYFFDEVNNVA